MNPKIDILDRTWKRGPQKLQALGIALSFNNQIIGLKIEKRSQIKDLVRIHFDSLPRSTQYKLRQDLAQELKFNQKQYKRTLKMNKKAEKIILNSTHLLH